MPELGYLLFHWLMFGETFWVVLSGANVRIFSFERGKKKENVSETEFLFGKYGYFCGEKGERNMSYSEMVQLELMNAINSIQTEAELNEFKDLVARYFAAKAQKA